MKFGKRIDKKLGDKKTKTFFDLFPVNIKGETIWFEKITVLYECSFNGFGHLSWFKEEFIKK